jgi:murein DD-endopeptidase MepM/ murein hydrolase activator NlpD
MRNYWSSALNNIIAATVVAATLSYNAHAQTESFMYPVHPGQPGALTGTMGELRTTHFHSGIDIRTNNMTGYPVVASKSGYISRASMGSSGYGNVLYITHPDGYTTLYAHLEKFLGAVAPHVLAEQYKLKSGEIDLFFQPGQFPVKQGELIALSGNTGSSGGPHVHFDIRDPNNYALDPVKIAGFKELADNLPPVPEKIALVTLDKNARINDKFGRFEFYGSKIGNSYAITTPILASGLIGVELLAKDKLAPQSPFYGGVNYLEMWVDSALVFSQAIDKIDLNETRAIYTLMDFKTMRTKGTRFYKLYIEDGNTLKFYGASPSNGKVTVNPHKLSTIQIRMKDSRENVSVISFKLQPNPVIREVPTLEPLPATTDVAYEVMGNTLQVTARGAKELASKAKIYLRGAVTEVEPDYANVNRKVYLVDLRRGLPDSIVVNNKAVLPGLTATIPSGTEYKYYGDGMDLQFPVGALYDTAYINTAHYLRTGGEVFTIGTRVIPLHKNITVSLKTNNTYSLNDRWAVYRISGKSYVYIGGEWVNDRIQFTTRELGDFTLLRDVTPPTIRAISVNNQTVRFKIRDELSGIASFQASINGQWLLMHYDSKIATIWSERPDKMPLKGTLELVVTDNAGNKSTFKQTIP